MYYEIELIGLLSMLLKTYNPGSGYFQGSKNFDMLQI